MAKGIVKKTEREALKERRKSGQLKQDKQEARAAGLSRGEARKRAKRLSRVQALSKRKVMRAEMAAKQRRADFMASRAKSAPMAKPATSATTSTTRDVMTKEEGKRIMENNERAMLNRKNKANAKVGEMFEIIDSKGKKQKVMKKKAMYGSKVKAVKKAKNGGKIKKEQAKLDARGKKLQSENKPSVKNSMVKPLKVKSSKRGEAVQSKPGIAEMATSGPKLVKYYMSKAGGGMSREQAVAKMVRAKK
tara:strand:+ start:84 stop:827 length:744 start_codon:yes stop_codon:yes gene_type:complete